MKTVVKLTKTAIVWEEPGQTLFTPTTDMLRRTTGSTSAATRTMATEISSMDHNNTDTTRTPAEKPVMTIHSLPCRTTAGAHVISLMDHPLARITKEMTMTADKVMAPQWEVVGQMLCIATTFTSQEISRLLMTSNITWSTENPTSSSSRATTWCTEPSQSTVTTMPISFSLRNLMVRANVMK